MKSTVLDRVRRRAMEELNTRDAEGRKAARLSYQHIQALKEGRWTQVLEEINRQSRRTVRTLWLVAAFLVIASTGVVLHTVSGVDVPWNEVLWKLVLPGLWLGYGLYAVWITTKRLQHLERARVMLEIVREEEQARTAVEQEG